MLFRALNYFFIGTTRPIDTLFKHSDQYISDDAAIDGYLDSVWSLDAGW